MEPSDAILAQQAHSGDDSAASDLIRRYYESIYAYLRRLSYNEHDAADLTQKAFARAWKALGSFEARSEFKTWLYRIAHRTYVDWVRQESRQSLRDHRWWLEHDETTKQSVNGSPEEDLASRIYEGVERLDSESRLAIHLHYYQNLTLNQTAAVLEVSPSTVKNRLRQSLATLRRQLELQQTPNPIL